MARLRCALCGETMGWLSTLRPFRCTNPACGIIVCHKCASTGLLSKSCPKCGNKVKAAD
jgi:endogenous inhibitor of DNA gyrase (YacG/DUF329 family)